jgi:hypothetical protein
MLAWTQEVFAMSFRPALAPYGRSGRPRRRHRRARRRSSRFVSNLLGVLLNSALALFGIALFLGLFGRGCSTPTG